MANTSRTHGERSRWFGVTFAVILTGIVAVVVYHALQHPHSPFSVPPIIKGLIP